MTVNAFIQQETSSLELRIDQIVTQTTETGDERETLYCTDADGTQSRIEVAVSPQTDSPNWQRGRWYEFSEVSRTDSYTGAEFRFTPTDQSHSRIEPLTITSPETDTTAPRAFPRLGNQPDCLGLTIVAVPADEKAAVSPTAPESYELTAVCLNQFNSAATPTVYHREAPSSHDERLLLEHVFADIAETDAETIVAWQSGHVVASLVSRHRHLKSDEILTRNSADVFDGFFHADVARLGARHSHHSLIETAQSLGLSAEYPRFEPGALGRAPDEWRADWALERTSLTSRTDTRFTERDYHTLIDSYLAGDTTTPEALAACLKNFASTPLEPLQSVGNHEIAARLGCPKLRKTALSKLNRDRN